MTHIKHSPGPWECTLSKFGDFGVIRDANGQTLCHVCLDGPDHYLITAAPELLEALIGLMNLKSLTASGKKRAWNAAKKAIAKARGAHQGDT